MSERERPTKRLRRLSTEEEDESSANEDWISDAMKLNKRDSGNSRRSDQSADSSMNRPRRGVAIPTTATVKHSAPTPANPGQRSIRLTVKAPPSKLREVINGPQQLERPARPRQAPPRSSKNKKPIVEESSEEEREERGAEDDDDEDDEDDEDDDVHGRTISVTPARPPSLKISAPARKLSPNQTLKAPPQVQSVEEKEVQEDEELSDLESEDAEGDEEEEEDQEEEEEEEEEDEEQASVSASSDEGEDSELPPLDTITAAAQNLPGNDDDEDDDAASLSSNSSSVATSQAGTPDPNKLTRRQRRTSPTTLLALSNEAQKKKHFTAEQITMRRAEMARRRKDLSDKRNEEEKADTLKRLLEKPTGPKRRSRAQVLADMERDEFGGVATPGEEGEEGEVVRARSGWIRYVCTVKGTRLGVPEEWLEGPVGRIYEGGGKRVRGEDAKVVGGSRMVRVVE